MNKLITLLFFSFSLNVFSQSEEEILYVTISAKDWDSLVSTLRFQKEEIENQQEQIKLVLDKISEYRKLSEELSKMKKENEILRDIMKGYIHQIDKLNLSLQKANTKLEECEK